MTTPARTLEDTHLDSGGYTQTWEVYNTGVTTPVVNSPIGTFTSGAVRDIRPESITSPVRDDGTRGPKPWDHRWGQYSNPYKQVTTVTKYSNRRRFVTYVGMPLLGTASMASLLSRAGASWCNQPAGAFPYAAEALARTSFRNAVAQGTADWGVALGEMRETVRGINTYCQDVLSLAEYLAKKYRMTKRAVVETILGIPPKTKKTPPWYRGKDRMIIDHWLAYQFAAKPLLNDIQSSGEALSKLLFDDGKRMLMKFKKGGSDVSETSSFLPGYPISGPFTGTGVFEVKTQCHIACIYELVPGTTRTLQEVGLTNPLSVAWELTTLSWGVDYVSNMGDWLQSLAPPQGADFVEGSLTRVMRVRSLGGIQNAQPVAPAELYSGNLNRMRYGLNAGRMQRVVLTDTPAPAILPAWRNRIGLTRMANLLAVTTKLLR